MNSARFDIAFVGDSLATRMAAALLAKHGRRVLLLATPFHADPWQHPSLFVDNLLGALGCRDGLTPTRQPFQVLSSRARITIHPDWPLETELSREFGESAPKVAVLLDTLARDGNALEDLLWENGGLPTGGMRATLAWRWLCLRRKLSLSHMAAPLTEHLRHLPEPANEWLRDLFQGLSLRPLPELVVADAALLWANALRPGHLQGEEILRLLNRRFDQFHGTDIALEGLDSLAASHGQWHGTLSGGRRFQAEHLVLGDLAQELPGQHPPRFRSGFLSARHYMTTPLNNQFSRLLENRIVVGGPHPLRLSMVESVKGTIGDVHGAAEASDTEIRRQLEPVLPFARYALEAQAQNRLLPTSVYTPATIPLLFKLPLRLGDNLWCLDETRLVPQLGCGGAALLAWTLARQFHPAIMVHGN